MEAAREGAEDAVEASARRSIELYQRLSCLEIPAGRARMLWDRYSPAPDGAELLLSDPSLSPKDRERMAAAAKFDAERIARMNYALALEDEFPETLEVEHPLGLFYSGDWSSTLAPCVSIVGTRSATYYGKAVAEKFAESFAKAGLVVVSGGALGIDAAAHEGALRAGGRTVAVFAGGLDQIYPATHAALFQRIAASGCLVSQFAVGSRARGYRFLARNRVVAALGLGLVVVEAPERSGALATVTAALDFGRPVFVVPGAIDNLQFRGSHALIRDGAELVDHPDQVLQSLGFAPAAFAAPRALQGDAEKVASALTTRPIDVDKLAEQLKLDSIRLSAILTDLELEGVAKKISGGWVKTL